MKSTAELKVSGKNEDEIRDSLYEQMKALTLDGFLIREAHYEPLLYTVSGKAELWNGVFTVEWESLP